MSKLVHAFLFCLVALLFATTAHAQVRFATNLPKLVQESDLICIGTIMKSTIINNNDIAHLTILQVLKGKAPTKSLIIGRWHETAIPMPLNYGLFFLNGNSSSYFWTPVDASQSVEDLGPVVPQSVSSKIPLRAVVLTLARALATSSGDARLQLLSSLSDASIVRKRQSSHASQLSTSVEEGPGFQQFLAENVLPLVKLLDNTPDMATCVSALKVQAEFQDQSAFPILLHIMNTAGNAPDVPGYVNNAASAFACYDTLAAAPLMLRLLHSPIHRIRYAALTSLVNILGRAGIPLLIDRIEGETVTDQSSVFWWLYEVTGEMDPRQHDSITSHPQEYVDYWQHWKKTHEAEIKKFRVQLYTLAGNYHLS